MASKGDYVTIYDVVLTKDERAPQVPDDTKMVPLEMRVRGFLTHDASLEEHVTIETITGRSVSGTLIEIAPTYTHSFGKHVPEIFEIGKQLRALLFGGQS